MKIAELPARAVAGRDRLVLVVGPAGTGKTTTLERARLDLADQHRSVELHRALPPAEDGSGVAAWAVKHLQIIERFGRFPHRNAALGRDTTAEEQAYLDDGGFKG